jgi:hypothetical protein
MIVNRDPKPNKPAFSMTGSSSFGFRPDYRNTYQDRTSLRLVVARGRAMYECSERPNKPTQQDAFRGELSVETFNDAQAPDVGSLAVFDQYDTYDPGTGELEYLSSADQLRMIAYLPADPPPFAEADNLIAGDTIVATDERLPDTVSVAEFSFEPVVSTLQSSPIAPAWAPEHWSGIALALRFHDSKTQLTVFFCCTGTGEDDAWIEVAGPRVSGTRKPHYTPSDDVPHGVNALQFNWRGGSFTYTLGYGEDCGLYLMADDYTGTNGISQLLLWDPGLSILGGDVNQLGSWFSVDAKVSAMFAHTSDAGIYEELYLNFLRLYNYGNRAVYGKHDDTVGLGINSWIREIPNWGTEYPAPRGEKGFPWEMPQTWMFYEVDEKISTKELSGDGVRLYKSGAGPCYFFRNEPELQELQFGTDEVGPLPAAAHKVGGVWSVFPGSAWALDTEFYASQMRADPSAGGNTGMGISIVNGDPAGAKCYNFRLLSISGGKYLGLQTGGSAFLGMNFEAVDRDSLQSNWGAPRRLRIAFCPQLNVVSVIDRDQSGMPIYYAVDPVLPNYNNHVDHGFYAGFLDEVDSDAFISFRDIRVQKRLVSYEAWWDVLGGAGEWTPDNIDDDELKWTRVKTDGAAHVTHPSLVVTKPATPDAEGNYIVPSYFYYKRIDPVFDNTGAMGFTSEFVFQVTEHVSENSIANGYDSRLGVGVGINIPVLGMLQLALVNLKPYGPAIVVEQNHWHYDPDDEDAFWKLVMANDPSVQKYVLLLDWKQRRELRVVFDPVYGLTLYVEDRRALDLTIPDLKLPDVAPGITSFRFGVILPTKSSTVTKWERFSISYATGNDYVVQSAMDPDMANKMAGGREIMTILCNERYVL